MIWLNIKQLEGQTLKTLDQNKPFDIVEVQAEKIIVRPKINNKERPITRETIESAFNQLALRGELSRVEIHNQFSDFNPAYVAAILAALPNVTYLTKPIRLYYKTN